MKENQKCRWKRTSITLVKKGRKKKEQVEKINTHKRLSRNWRIPNTEKKRDK